MSVSTERLTEMVDVPSNRWSRGTTSTDHSLPDRECYWEAPPIPPIPMDVDDVAWRRRSMKRASYTSKMSGGGGQTPFDRLSTVDVADLGSRPCSVQSSPSTPRPSAGKTIKQSLLEEQPPVSKHTDVHWDMSPLNPVTWSVGKKFLHTIGVASIAFTITLASAITILTTQNFESHFARPTALLANLQTSLFLLALALGPLIARPCTAVLGRKVMYTLFTPVFVILTLVAGFLKSAVGIGLCRCLAGLFAGPALTVGSLVLTDIWTLGEHTIPLTLYYAPFVAGPSLGIVVGGVLAESLSGKWTQFIILMLFAACCVPLAMMRESSRATIIRRQERGSVRQSLRDMRLCHEIVEPLLALANRPIIVASSIYGGLVFGVLYALAPALFSAFSEAYKTSHHALMFLAMVVGCVVGFVVLLWIDKDGYRPRLKARKQAQSYESSNDTAAQRHGRQNTPGTTPTSDPIWRQPQATASALSLPTNEKNMRLAVATADYLNGVPANKGRHIVPERVLLILNRTSAFGEICAALEAYHLRLDPVQLASVLVEALNVPEHAPAAAPLLQVKSPLDRSTFLPSTRQPPAEWRLWPSLPGSLLAPTGLLIAALTTSPHYHWIAPCVGLALFTLGATMTFVSMQMYLLDRFAPAERHVALDAGIVVRYLFGFVGLMVVKDMVDGLGFRWAVGVMALLVLGAGLVPWVLFWVDCRKRGRGSTSLRGGG